MIDYGHFGLFQQGSVDKQWKIEYGEKGVITNEELFSESIELSETLCSENALRFGCCEASILKFKVANIISTLKGKWLAVKLVLGHNLGDPFIIGRYKVDSDKLTADRMWREIVAYDAMYDIINADVTDWYNSILPNENSEISMREFRSSFIRHFGLEQEEINLVNDGMVVRKTIQPSQISGKDIITAICEINGCFGHIGRDGKFHYIYLEQNMQGLFPANDLFPSDDLFPKEPKSIRISQDKSYKSCKFEDFITGKINKLQIRQTKDDVGEVYPAGEVQENDNCYIVEDNFLVYGMSAEELHEIAENLHRKISGVSYRPFELEARGNPCFEVGDAVRTVTEYVLVETYILERTMKGIQAIMDTYSSKGAERYEEPVNSINNSILQLKGKTNELVRTVEETKSTITDVEEGLQSQIKQTKDSIEEEVSARTKEGEEIKASIKLKIDKDDDGTIVSLINGSADKIHFGANNMFTVDSPNFEVDENGNIFLIGNIKMRYRIGNFRPPQYGDFTFAETYTDEGGIPYLRMNSPGGTSMIECGQKFYITKPSDMHPYAIETPIFNNGIYAEKAVIASLFEDYKEFPNFSNGLESIYLRVRVSGAFVSLYGGYHAYTQKGGESKTIVIGSGAERFLPTHQAVRAVGFQGKRVFVFVISTDGVFTARNASDIDLNSAELTDIKFRFDFFRF